MLYENALTTYERVRDRLELEDDKQPFIEDAINTASALIESFCNRRFEKGVYTDIVAESADEHFFSQFPVHEVISLNQQPLDDPFMDEEAGILYHRIPARSRVVYRAGYILPRYASQLEPQTLPADLEDACIRLVKYMYSDDETVSERDMQSGMKSFDLGDFKAVLGSGARPASVIPDDIQGLLVKHRKVNL